MLIFRRAEWRVVADVSALREQVVGLPGTHAIECEALNRVFRPLDREHPYLDSESQLEAYYANYTDAIDSIRQGERSDSSVGKLRRELSKQDIFESDLRLSRLSKIMRIEAEVFDYSEYEFREIFRSRMAMAEVINSTDKMELENSVRELLGTDRYQEYRIALDPVLRSVFKKKLGGSISESAIDDVLSMVGELDEAYEASNINKIREITKELRSTVGDDNASQIQTAVRARNNGTRTKTSTFDVVR